MFLRNDEELDLERNVKRGIVAVVCISLAFCSVQLRDSLVMIRPHPVVWRLVTGMALLYWLFCVFLLFLSRDQARHFFCYLYKDLGQPLPERSYAHDCRLFTPENPHSVMNNVRETLWDEFVIAHTIGYVCKTLLFRDWKLCWIISVSFELAEITFQHWLDNFKECWWDHVFFAPRELFDPPLLPPLRNRQVKMTMKMTMREPVLHVMQHVVHSC